MVIATFSVPSLPENWVSDNGLALSWCYDLDIRGMMTVLPAEADHRRVLLRISSIAA